MHYQRLRVHGSLADPRPTADENFWRKVAKSDGCWEWAGARDSHGYGAFTVDNKMYGAHRWIFERTNGPVPDGLMVDHMCHNQDPTCAGGKNCAHRRCVNPDHLTLATNRENQARAQARFARPVIDTLTKQKESA